VKNLTARPARPTHFRRQWDAYQTGRLTYAEAFAPIAEAPPSMLTDKRLASVWDEVNQRFKPRPPEPEPDAEQGDQ
jgi:hypothetical protein